MVIYYLQKVLVLSQTVKQGPDGYLYIVSGLKQSKTEENLVLFIEYYIFDN